MNVDVFVRACVKSPFPGTSLPLVNLELHVNDLPPIGRIRYCIQESTDHQAQAKMCFCHIFPHNCTTMFSKTLIHVLFN